MTTIRRDGMNRKYKWAPIEFTDQEIEWSADEKCVIIRTTDKRDFNQGSGSRYVYEICLAPQDLLAALDTAVAELTREKANALAKEAPAHALTFLKLLRACTD